MKTHYGFIITIFMTLMLSGCWDQDSIKDTRLSYAVGFDQAAKQKLLTTIVIHDMPSGEKNESKNDIISSVGSTPRENRDYANQVLSGQLRTYKNRIILIGEERAKQDIYPILDIFYRDPKSALNARIAVAHGLAKDILFLKKVGNVPIEEEIDNVIKSSEENSKVVKVTAQKIFPIMMDPGHDYLLPYISQKGSRVEVSGTAMFHKNEYRGTLNSDESTMCILLNGKKGGVARFTQELSEKSKYVGYDYVTFNVEKSKRKMDIKVNTQGEIMVALTLKWKVDVVEFPKDHLNNKKEVEQLTQFLTAKMTDLAVVTIKKMQEARCDGFGVGRRLIAFHPSIWKPMKDNWGEQYSNIRFEPKIDIKIVKNGIIN